MIKRWLFLFVGVFCLPISGVPAPSKTLTTYLASRHIIKNDLLNPPDEGFLADTKVCTNNEFTAIENLEENDTITNIALRLVPHYFTIVSDTHEEINAGPDQQLCVIRDYQKYWVTTQDLQPGDLLQGAGTLHKIHSVEKVDTITTTYAVTTTNHTLHVTNNTILAHNADAATAVITMGYVSTLNPVVATIGATVALSIAGKYLYNIYKRSQHKKKAAIIAQPCCSQKQQPSSEQLHHYETQYYNQRKNDLEKLKHQLENMHEGLESVAQWYRNGKFNVSFNLFDQLKKIENNLSYTTKKPSICSSCCPSNASAHYYEKIRQFREKELLHFEQEIINQQDSLVFYFNELIERAQYANQQLAKSINNNNDITARWNQWAHYMSFDLAIQNYEEVCITLHDLDNLENKLNELKIAIEFYQKSENSIIRRTTNISALTKELQKWIKVRKQYIAKQRAISLQNKTTIEQYIATARTRTHFIDKQKLDRNVQNTIAKRDHTYNAHYGEVTYKKRKKTLHHKAQLSKKVQTSSDNPCTCGCGCSGKSCGCSCGCGCYKFSYPYGEYEGAPYHHKNSRGRKSPAPKNGQHALDNSIPIGGNSAQRIAISNGKFVVLFSTGNGKYHGHVRTWDELSDAAKSALRKAGKTTKSGKIISK